MGRPDFPGLLVGMDSAPRVMFPSVVARPRMLCIKAGMDQKDSSLRASRRTLATLWLHTALFPCNICAWITSSSSACCCSCTPRTLRPVYVLAQAHYLLALRPPRFFLDYCDELFPVWLFLAESENQRTLPLNISSEMLWRAHPGHRYVRRMGCTRYGGFLRQEPLTVDSAAAYICRPLAKFVVLLGCIRW